jgi:hypothetical protein
MEILVFLFLKVWDLRAISFDLRAISFDLETITIRSAAQGLTMVTNHGYLPWLLTMVTNHGYSQGINSRCHTSEGPTLSYVFNVYHSICRPSLDLVGIWSFQSDGSQKRL